MTLKEINETSNSQINSDRSLQHRIEQSRRDIHEFLGLLGELASAQADQANPHYRKVITTTLHTVPVIISQLESLNQSLEKERLIHNDLYAQNNPQTKTET